MHVRNHPDDDEDIEAQNTRDPNPRAKVLRSFPTRGDPSNLFRIRTRGGQTKRIASYLNSQQDLSPRPQARFFLNSPPAWGQTDDAHRTRGATGTTKLLPFEHPKNTHLTNGI